MRSTLHIAFFFLFSVVATSQPPTITSFTPKAGRPGDVVEIQGTGFHRVADNGVSGVKFGGAFAEATTVVSSTTIAAQMGDGSSGTVSVIDTSGASASGTVFLLASPLPYHLSFENRWRSRLATRDIPSQHSETEPATGNAWRRSDDLASAGFANPGLGAYTAGNGTSMRFHTAEIPTGTTATFRFAVTLPLGASAMSFDYINTTGSDSLTIFVDKNSDGSTVQVLRLGVSTTWSNQFIDLQPYGGGNATISFIGRSDGGTSDIGVDEISVYRRANPVVDCQVYLQGMWNGTSQRPSVFMAELWNGDDFDNATKAWSGAVSSTDQGRMLVQPDDIAEGLYWLVVRHPGHLAMASSARVRVYPDELTQWFFPAGPSQARGFQTTVQHPGGGYMMRSGDTNNDYDVTGADYQEVTRNFGNSSIVPPP